MFLSDPEWQAVLLSLKVSSLAVVLSLPFGIFFSWLLVRRDFPGKALLDSILHLCSAAIFSALKIKKNCTMRK